MSDKTENKKADIAELKNKVNTKTMNFVLLSIATAGIYPILWVYKHYQSIDSITRANTCNDNYIIFIAVAAGMGGVLSSIPVPATMIIGNLLSIVVLILYAMWSFKVKKALEEYVLNEHKIDLRMNPVYTFLFNVFYVNYIINDLPEEAKKQEILQSKD